jgi:hypothetical protein
MIVRLSLPSFFVILGVATNIVPSNAVAQLPGTRVPGGCDVPAANKTTEVGCYLAATEVLDTLPTGEICDGMAACRRVHSAMTTPRIVRSHSSAAVA